jgi:hypothetical protein
MVSAHQIIIQLLDREDGADPGSDTILELAEKVVAIERGRAALAEFAKKSFDDPFKPRRYEVRPEVPPPEGGG